MAGFRMLFVFFFKQKTAYEMRISDWSSDVCSSDLRPHSFTHHGITVSDDYAWLRDPGYPKVEDADVLSYLKAENAYFETAMAPHRALIDTLFAEMRGQIGRASCRDRVCQYE